jgi:hypothetical protein
MLDASRLYYTRLAQSLVKPASECEGGASFDQQRTCATFFAEVEKRLADEIARSEHYLHESTAPKLKAVVRFHLPPCLQCFLQLRCAPSGRYLLM